jgi:hypothetical protein
MLAEENLQRPDAAPHAFGKRRDSYRLLRVNNDVLFGAPQELRRPGRLKTLVGASLFWTRSISFAHPAGPAESVNYLKAAASSGQSLEFYPIYAYYGRNAQLLSIETLEKIVRAGQTSAPKRRNALTSFVAAEMSAARFPKGTDRRISCGPERSGRDCRSRI